MKTLPSTLKSFFKDLHQKSYFKQILFSYILICCITFIIFSILLISRIQDENYREMLEINQQNIVQAASFNDSSLINIYTFCYNIMDDPTVHKLLFGKNYETSTAVLSRDTYTRIASISSMITSLDFINFSTETVLTKRQRTPFSQYYDQALLDYIETLTPGRFPVFYEPRESYINGIQKEPQKVLSLVFHPFPDGALVVNIDYETYASQINLARNADNIEMIILNQNNKVMAATDSSLFMEDFSKNPLYETVISQNAVRGTFSYGNGSKAQTVSYLTNSRMGMTYLSILKSDKFHIGSRLITMTLQYSVIYVFITSLLCLLSSWIIYRPVQKLKSTITSHASETKDLVLSENNDFEYLESAYQSLLLRISTLNKENRSYEEQNDQKLLYRLLIHNGVENSVKIEDLENFDSSFPYKNYQIFVVDTDFSNASSSLDLALLKFIITNVAGELFGSSVVLKNIDTLTAKLIFLLNFEQYDRKFLEQAAHKMQSFFETNRFFGLSIGFGDVTSDLDSLFISYENAKTALSNGLLNTNRCIQFYEDLALVPLSRQKYPYEADMAIIAALKNLNSDSASQELDLFFDSIRNYHYEQIYRYIKQLSASFQYFEYQNELSVPQADHDLDSLPHHTLPEIKQEMKQRCLNDIEALREIKFHSHQKADLIDQVQKIVAENIYNPNLSVIMIAEEVNLSVNYLRNIYKENTGDSLSNYIIRQKLDIICDLLANTDISIQEISDRLGFTTKNYFFTFFKKHMSMTPGQYRNSCPR